MQAVIKNLLSYLMRAQKWFRFVNEAHEWTLNITLSCVPFGQALSK